VTTQKSHGSFIDAMCNELEYYAKKYVEPVESIYLGGGTPSLLQIDELARLLTTIERNFDVSLIRETTIEMNPEAAELDYLQALRSLGVNRLSLGVQSFFPSDLEFMNRSHTAEQAETSIDLVKKAGFENFSVDLIFGIPGQPVEYWFANIQKVIRLGAPHISTYNLTIEERTPLYKMVEKGAVHPAPEDELEEKYRFTMDFLRQHGYEHYEISSFALPGMRSQHNQVYWDHKNYLGFGPSAHSFWWRGLPAYRWHNERNLRRYEALLQQHQLPIEGKEAMSLDMLANEYILLKLRTSEGIELDRLQNQYGVDLIYEKEEQVEELVQEGYVDPSVNGHLKLTDSGKLLCDAITYKLLLDAD
jgi:oxygen-independent coproporphyrinogen-3 oxidase